jgi:hypothetical protein
MLATTVDDTPWAATVDYRVGDDLNIFITSNQQSLK